MTFVVDASVVASWLLPDEHSAAGDAIADRLETETALAPDLLWHEVRNLLLKAHRRGRLSQDEFFAALGRFGTLPLQLSSCGDGMRIAQLALTYRLSAYDAAYLALAKIEGVPLASFDALLRQAAAAERVPVAPAM